MIPYVEWRLIQLGPIPIQVWGLWVALGIGLGVWLLTRAMKRYSVEPEPVMDLATYLIIGGFVGARLVHAILYEPATFFEDPVELIRIWHGGLSSFGGFGGALVALWVYKKRKGFSWLKTVPMMQFLDHTATALLAGWMIGRVGCVMIHDHPGQACGCVLDLQGDPLGDRMDMALLEIIGLLPLGIFFIWLRKRGVRQHGLFLYILMLYYGVLRFILDFWRATDIVQADARYGGLTPAQYFSILMAIVGSYQFLQLRKK